MNFIAFAGSNKIAVKESKPGGDITAFPIISAPEFSGPQQMSLERIKSSDSGNDVAWGDRRKS